MTIVTKPHANSPNPSNKVMIVPWIQDGEGKKDKQIKQEEIQLNCFKKKNQFDSICFNA